MVTTLHIPERNVKIINYLHYTAALNLANIEFSMTLKDIFKFEHLNAVTINGIENGQILPVRLIGNKRDKHVNVLYLQDPTSLDFIDQVTSREIADY